LTTNENEFCFFAQSAAFSRDPSGANSPVESVLSILPEERAHLEALEHLLARARHAST
jgi:hypothetical protein